MLTNLERKERAKAYAAKRRKNPAVREKQAAYAKSRYQTKKNDPSYVKKTNERNLRDYYTKVKTSEEAIQKRRIRVAGYQRKRRERFNEKKIQLQQLIGSKCVSCGLTDHRLLDFDHIDPISKTMMISQQLHRPIEELIEEVKRCQLMCPNCHRLKTIEQGGFDYRIRDYRNKSRESSFTSSLVLSSEVGNDKVGEKNKDGHNPKDDEDPGQRN